LNAPHWDNEMNVPAPKEYMATLGPNPTKREIYLGALRAIDDCVKEISETLKKHKLLENTVFIFTSDQGAWQPTAGSNGPLRGFKGNYAFYEGGLRIPFIMLWPGKEKALKAISKPANLLDVFPTLATNLNFKYNPEQHPGKDLFSPEERTLFAFHGFGKNMIHHKGWKFAEIDDKKYLFHLEEDPYEKKNLINSHPEKAKMFTNLLNQYKEGISKDK